MDIEQLRDLLFEIAPELQATDCRVEMLDASWPVTQQLAAGGTYAVAVRGLFPELRARWEQEGTWPGAWPQAIGFIDAVDGMVPGILCHEAAHLLPARRPVPDRQQIDTEESLAEFMEWREQYVAATAQPVVPWADHDERFIRRSIHLWWRARLAGCRFDIQELQAGGPTYGLSPVVDYAIALGSEVEDMVGCSFSLIDSTPAPEAFRLLFAQDAATWLYDNGYADLTAESAPRTVATSKTLADLARRDVSAQSPMRLHAVPPGHSCSTN